MSNIFRDFGLRIWNRWSMRWHNLGDIHLLQTLQRIHIVKHVTIGRCDHVGSEARNHIAREEDARFFQVITEVIGAMTSAPSDPPPKIIVLVPGPVMIEGLGARIIVYEWFIKALPTILSCVLALPRYCQHLPPEIHAPCHLPAPAPERVSAHVMSRNIPGPLARCQRPPVRAAGRSWRRPAGTHCVQTAPAPQMAQSRCLHSSPRDHTRPAAKPER